VPEAPPEHCNHRRLTWPIVAILVAVGLALSARWSLHLYRCHVVDRQARKSNHRLIMEPIGPQWVHRLLGSSAGFALGRPRRVELELRSSRESRAGIESVLWCLSGLDSIEQLGLEGDGVTDADVLRLRELLNLTHLGLAETRVTVRGLAILGELPNLSWLRIRESTRIDDSALIQVARSPRLEELYIDETAVTDAGLAQLIGLTKLQRLSLNSTAVSDTGLCHLRSLRQLKFLSLSNTSVTDAGVEALRVELPDLEVTDD
jgi:hypothetical protein